MVKGDTGRPRRQNSGRSPGSNRFTVKPHELCRHSFHQSATQGHIVWNLRAKFWGDGEQNLRPIHTMRRTHEKRTSQDRNLRTASKRREGHDSRQKQSKWGMIQFPGLLCHWDNLPILAATSLERG